ncbi:hypothetical protein [Chryseobacterium sp.]|uniref:hypothetical protein n=1 Tax=Chryseobacterium sp. TaxID=1871047 RepID=UPI0025BE1234|nr:hypothetical protein [Chryseobacterium sp.]MBV8328646.1 right-handed parallel beta-helix repeat-containing protein [Chryseobacterium sp.]
MNLKKIYYLVFLPLLFSCNSFGQSPGYKSVPEIYNRIVAVTSKERDSIRKTILKPFFIESVLPKGYVKNGSVDYTKEIQEALRIHRNVIFPNFPVLINEKGLTVFADSNLFFDSNSKIVLNPNSLAQYEILRIHDVKNVKVFFPNIKGDKYRHIGKNGEWGMGISLRGTDNVLIYSPVISECWGDGIYLGISPVTNSGINNNIRIIKAKIDDNRRNGMSIISAQNMTVNKFVVSNTNGAPPNAGIDIEPDANTDIIKNLSFNNIVSFNNDAHGFLFVLGHLYGKESDLGKIELNNFKSINGMYGISLRIGSDANMNLKPSGIIEIANTSFENVSHQDYFSYDENVRNNIQVKIKAKDNKAVTKYRPLFKNSQKIIITQ